MKIKNWTKFNESFDSHIVKGVEITKFFQSDRYKKFIQPFLIEENELKEYFSDVLDGNSDIKFELTKDTIFFLGNKRVYGFKQADSSFVKYSVSLLKMDGKSTSIKSFKEYLNKYLDLLEDIEIAIERIRDDYDIRHKVEDNIDHFREQKSIVILFYKEIPFKELMSEFKLFLSENDASSWLVKGISEFKKIFTEFGAPESFKLEDHIDLHPDWEENEFGDVVVGVSLNDEISAIGTIDKETGKINYNTNEISKVIKELFEDEVH